MLRRAAGDRAMLPAAPNGCTDAYYAGAAEVAQKACTSQRQALRERLTPDATGIVLVMVGLPARGKSFISRKLERFLQWKGLRTQMFNVGKYRRDGTAPEQSGRSEFFDASNCSAHAAREAAAATALTDVLAFLDDGGQIAIFDATNSVSSRRRYICERFSRHQRQYSILFVEVICDDSDVVEANMLNKVQNSPDFKHREYQEALVDLKARIAKYEEVYETVRDDEGPYIKLYNLSTKVLVNHCYGRIARSVLPYLMGVHIGTRPIWLVRAGAGEANPQTPPDARGRLLGLSGAGRGFSMALAGFVGDRAADFWQAMGKEQEPTRVISSTMPRAVASARYASPHQEQTSALNALDKGAIGEGWWDVECGSDVPPWKEVERRHPEFWDRFQQAPLRCRFPGGESYMDVVQRLEGLLTEVEMCTRPVLIVSHITVLQLLLAYFRGIPVEEAWHLPVPKNTVFEAVPSLGGGFVCSEHALSTAATSGGGGGARAVDVCSEAPAEANETLQGGACKRPRTK